MKKISIIAFLFIIVFCLCILSFSEVLGLFPPSKSNVEKKYSANEFELTAICSFLQENHYSDILIDLFDSTTTMTCYTSNNYGGYDKETFEITDRKLIDALKKLENNDFIRIKKEHNYIFFQTWGSFGESIGLIFSPNQYPNVLSTNAQDQTLENIKPQNWFYYRVKYE